MRDGQFLRHAALSFPRAAPCSSMPLSVTRAVPCSSIRYSRCTVHSLRRPTDVLARRLHSRGSLPPLQQARGRLNTHRQSNFRKFPPRVLWESTRNLSSFQKFPWKYNRSQWKSISRNKPTLDRQCVHGPTPRSGDQVSLSLTGS